MKTPSQEFNLTSFEKFWVTATIKPESISTTKLVSKEDENIVYHLHSIYHPDDRTKIVYVFEITDEQLLFSKRKNDFPYYLLNLTNDNEIKNNREITDLICNSFNK